MPHAFFTIGHSNRSVDEFVELLKEAEIDLVVDVRTVTRSRSNPQFNAEPLRAALEKNQIGYFQRSVGCEGRAGSSPVHRTRSGKTRASETMRITQQRLSFDRGWKS